MDEPPFADILANLMKRMENDPESLRLLAQLAEMLGELWVPIKLSLDLSEKAKEISARGREKHSPALDLEEREKVRERVRGVIEAMKEEKSPE